MPFISALNLVETSESAQTDNLTAAYAVSGLVDDSFYTNFTSGQTSVLDTVDRLDLYETAASVDLEALQVPRRTIKFGG
jgi:aromatic ring hydroxylase